MSWNEYCNQIYALRAIREIKLEFFEVTDESKRLDGTPAFFPNGWYYTVMNGIEHGPFPNEAEARTDAERVQKGLT